MTDARALSEVARTSLSKGAVPIAFVPALVISLVLAGVSYRALQGELRNWMILASFAVPLVSAALLSTFVLTPMRAARELEWLAKIPFPFAHAGYVDVMSRTGDKVSLDLHLTFRAPLAQNVLEAALEAGAVTGSPRRRGDRTYLVSSPSFDARHENNTGTKSNTTYDNAPLHRWFKTVAFPTLVALQREQGLESVEIEA